MRDVGVKGIEQADEFDSDLSASLHGGVKFFQEPILFVVGVDLVSCAGQCGVCRVVRNRGGFKTLVDILAEPYRVLGPQGINVEPPE